MRLWTQRKSLVAAGKRPNRILISKAGYLSIQQYHRRLGSLPEGVADYISRYALFDLPFFLDEGCEGTVGCEEDDSRDSSE